jgi:hypothetical protein
MTCSSPCYSAASVGIRA